MGFHAKKKDPWKEVIVLEKMGERYGKKVVNVLAAGKILEVTEDPKEQGHA